jgi:hypothetical protein
MLRRGRVIWHHTLRVITHTPLAKSIPGLRRFEAARGVATPDGGDLPYHRIAELVVGTPVSGRRPVVVSVMTAAWTWTA